MRRARVAEHVWRQPLVQSAPLAVLPHDRARPTGESAARRVGSGTPPRRHCVEPTDRAPAAAALPPPASPRAPLSGATERHDPFLRSLAEATGRAPSSRSMSAERQAHGFADPCAGGVQQLEQRAIAQRATGSLPTTAAIKEFTSPSLSGFGMPAGTLTPSRSAVGSSTRMPSSTKNRCSIRIAASCRATSTGAALFDRRSADEIGDLRAGRRHHVGGVGAHSHAQ